MNLVGQIVLSAPVVWAFGHRIAALQVEVALLGVAGLYATYDLARQLTSQRRALFVALMVAVGPLWQMLSVSYMTDVPAYALMMICLALGARCLASGRCPPGALLGVAGRRAPRVRDPRVHVDRSDRGRAHRAVGGASAGG